MQRNFKLIFNGFLFISILINILFLIIITLDYVFDLMPTILALVKFDIIISILIIVHIFLNLKNQKDKQGYMVRNWLDIFAILPLAYLVVLIAPSLKLVILVLFLLRLYALFRYMLKIRDVIKFTRKTRLDYATFILLFTLIFGAMLFYWVESPVNPQASNIDNSLFFMIVTMSTVGYGNIVPYTGVGKLIAVVAIVVGIGYTGWVTAAIASSLIDEYRKESKSRIKQQDELMEEVLFKLNKIEKELEEIKDSKKP